MIEAKDLRIGNLVTDEFYENFNTIITVHSINKEGVNLEIEDDGNWAECAQRWIGVEYKFDKLFGIPLTPEILEKCGFAKLPNCFDCERFHIAKEDEADYWWCFFNKNGAFINKIKYLHQLQNLYFALTGEELTINL